MDNKNIVKAMQHHNDSTWSKKNKKGKKKMEKIYLIYDQEENEMLDIYPSLDAAMVYVGNYVANIDPNAFHIIIKEAISTGGIFQTKRRFKLGENKQWLTNERGSWEPYPKKSEAGKIFVLYEDINGYNTITGVWWSLLGAMNSIAHIETTADRSFWIEEYSMEAEGRCLSIREYSREEDGRWYNSYDDEVIP